VERAGAAPIHKDPRRLRTKLRYLDMVLAKSTIVGIQETHGTVEKMRLELAQYRLQWRIFVSASANPNSGGVILFFRKSAFPSDARFLLEAIVPGRVLKVSVRTGNAVGKYGIFTTLPYPVTRWSELYG